MVQFKSRVLALSLALSVLGATSALAGGTAPVCGNGVTEPGEQCDDGGHSNGGGCCTVSCTFDPACTCCNSQGNSGADPGHHVQACYMTLPGNTCYGTAVPNAHCGYSGCEPNAVCGNGKVEPGEQCDDGGTANGDCCDSKCQFESSKSTCGDDKNICTSDVCDGKGLCVHETANPLPQSCGCCEYALSERTVRNSCYASEASACKGSFFANSECTAYGCQGPVCGNGVLEAGEDCDPGTAQGGRVATAVDCCDAKTCKFQQAGSSCTADTNVCTDDQCNAIGQCTHPNNTSPCDDGDLCTNGDVCSGGSCSGTAFVPPACDDGNVCTNDSCSANACTHSSNTASCEDGQFCTVNDVCNDGTCRSGSARDCGAGNACITSSCNEDLNQCVTAPDPSKNGQPCDDGNACTTGTSCSTGVCAGGSVLTCNDNSDCTQDSCNPATGCVYKTVVETPVCGSCDDGIDNDGDNDIDSEDCGCATLCAQQRFAIVNTFTPNRFDRQALYCGSDVQIGDGPAGPFPTAGVCTTNAAYRAGVNVGLIATTGSSYFGKGSSLTDPTQVDSGSDRALVVRKRFDSDGDPEVTKEVAPFVGEGTCSNNAMTVCSTDSDCGVGNNCQGQLHLSDMANTNVSRDGMAENFTRCVNAQATVKAEGDFIATLPGNVPGYTDGTVDIQTSGNTPMISITVGAGQQVLYVNRVIVTGNTVLQLVRDPMLPANAPPTVLVVRVRRQLRLGGKAEVQLQGILPQNVIWNAESAAGGKPFLLRDSKFKGTLLAADRRGVSIGGTVTVDGAVKSKRLHIGQGSIIHHFPFKPLLQ